ncbi:MAG: cellulase family glycosylhydrolase [Candidatus Moranbacteria bacterium]|nr:cellulase family glycosylhydrolase [Candidatus Moranbacteria bacterium]
MKKIIAGAKKTLQLIVYGVGIILSVIIMLFIYINLPASAAKNNDAKIGVTFSSIYAEQIGLDWREAYLAMIDDLQIKYVRLPVYWDRVEKSEGVYDFADLDWQLEQARSRGVEIVLVIGQKVPRWPECYVPKWVGEDPSNLDAMRLKSKLLKFDEVVIERYKNGHPEITRWQVENEPFLNFGICSKVDPALLDAEISKVRELDATRPIMVTDSGELSLWVNAAKRADIFGTTMYREVYSKEMGHWRYPVGPNFFKIKQLIIKLFADQDNAVVIELQGEPWVAGWTIDAPVETQLASMNAEILVDNIEFAKKTGMKEIYVWGVEWWYYMKTVQNNPTIWEAAKTLVQK